MNTEIVSLDFTKDEVYEGLGISEERNEETTYKAIHDLCKMGEISDVDILEKFVSQGENIQEIVLLAFNAGKYSRDAFFKEEDHEREDGE